MGTAVQDAVLAELAKILNSPQFARAERLSAFVRFIVDEASEGRGEALKDTVIGVEVFGKPVGYDPGLRDYYLTTGAEDELNIDCSRVAMCRCGRLDLAPDCGHAAGRAAPESRSCPGGEIP